MDIIKVISEKKTFVLFLNFLLTSIQRRMARNMDVKPGLEMITALEVAEKQSAQTEVIGMLRLHDGVADRRRYAVAIPRQSIITYRLQQRAKPTQKWERETLPVRITAHLKPQRVLVVSVKPGRDTSVGK